MPNASDHRYVIFPDGFATPIEPILLALELERRGCRLERVDGDLLIQPRSLLTDPEREQLRRWRFHLLALIDRCSVQ